MTSDLMSNLFCKLLKYEEIDMKKPPKKPIKGMPKPKGGKGC